MSYANSIRTRVVACLIAATLLYASVPAANAQSINMGAKIPFDFYVNGSRVPAGSYTIHPISGGAVVLLNNSTRKAVTTIMTFPGSYKLNPVTSAFVFAHVDNYYFLSELRWAGFELGRGLAKSKREVEMARTMPTRIITIEGQRLF